MYAMSRGLGATAAQIARCSPKADFWSFGTWVAALDPECWAYSPEAWREMALLPPLPAPVVNLPPPSNLPPASGAEAQATVDQIIAANKAAQDEQYKKFFESVDPIADSGGADLSWVWWAAGGVGAVILLSSVGRRRGRR